MQKENNYAFIDSQNLNLAIRGQGWKLDFKKFRIYIRDKFCTTKAFLFIGYVESNEELYKYLERAGYIIVFKRTLNVKGNIKGNVDAELVLHTMIEYNSYDKAVIVSGDGDFYCLAKHLYTKGKLKRVVVPNKDKYSKLLHEFHQRGQITFMSGLQAKLEEKGGHILETKLFGSSPRRDRLIV